MYISKLEEVDKNKVKVYIDDEYRFLLYKKDIRIHRLREEEEISDSKYADILKNTVLRRGKQKALSILKYMDRSEQELRFKLKQAEYTDSNIDMILDYVKQYRYVDDERYATQYVRFKKDNKSRRQLQMELIQKGIEKDLIDTAFEEEYNDEDQAIQKAITKKCKNIDELTFEEKMKLSAYLYRKGFQVDIIKKYLNT
jgi:regulatory protein